MENTVLAAPGMRNADFIDSANRLLVFDQWGQAAIDGAQKARCVVLATDVGEHDGSFHRNELQTNPVRLPSEDLMSHMADQATNSLGVEAGKAIARSKQGRLLVPNLPGPGKSGFVAFVRRHVLIIGILLAIAVVEYMIGIEVMNQVFSLADNQAYVMALVTPFVFALVFVTLAQAINTAISGWRSRGILIFGSIAAVLIVGFVIQAGLVVSHVVEPDSGTANQETMTFKAVRFGAYVCLMLAVCMLILTFHLLDLDREGKKDRRLSDNSALNPSQIAASNREYLAQYFDAYATLLGARREVIAAYVQGVKRNLDVTLQAAWNVDPILADPDEPSWHTDLVAELHRLEDQGRAGSAQTA